ncbi:MAG: shikimate dehydrogenase [Dehalococcoidia bacterium]|nr:shikimate dehydrogenase [Dehalococcoidia bacterium]
MVGTTSHPLTGNISISLLSYRAVRSPPMGRRYVGIIGYPLGHTLSPVFQQAALDFLKLDIRYEVWETPPDRLKEMVGSLGKSDVLGANVTIPHKQAVMHLIDSIDPAAKKIGAVNTVVNESGSLKGFNTDYLGFLRGLREAGCELDGRDVLLLGAGGAARAVACALLDNSVRSLTIVNRSIDRAEELSNGLTKEYQDVQGKVSVKSWTQDTIKGILATPHLVINCTSMGMKGGESATLSPLSGVEISGETVIYDLVYNPPETPLLKQALEVGAKAIPGLPMLIYQGAASFELWTGLKAPVDVMMKAATEAILR